MEQIKQIFLILLVLLVISGTENITIFLFQIRVVLRRDLSLRTMIHICLKYLRILLRFLIYPAVEFIIRFACSRVMIPLFFVHTYE